MVWCSCWWVSMWVFRVFWCLDGVLLVRWFSKEGWRWLWEFSLVIGFVVVGSVVGGG